jgi:hypothetical protein
MVLWVDDRVSIKNQVSRIKTTAKKSAWKTVEQRDFINIAVICKYIISSFLSKYVIYAPFSWGSLYLSSYKSRKGMQSLRPFPKFLTQNVCITYCCFFVFTSSEHFS